jgi:hypothetical protein
MQKTWSRQVSWLMPAGGQDDCAESEEVHLLAMPVSSSKRGTMQEIG